MKRIVSALLLSILTFGVTGTYANEVQADSEGSIPEEKSVYTLSLADAKKMAYEDNQQINAVEIKKYSLELEKKAAQEQKAKSKNAEVRVSSSVAPLLVKRGYYTELYGSQSELAKSELEQVKAKIDYDVTEKYYNLKLTERLVEVCNSAYNLAETNYINVQKMYELGLVAEVDVSSAEVAKRQAKSAAENYERTREIMKENLKIALNIDGDAEFVLTDGIDFEEFESDVEKDIEAAEKTRYDIKGLSESKRLADLNYSIIGAALSDRSASALTAKSNAIQAKYTYENSKKLIKLGIRSTYNEIITAKDNIEIAEINRDINNKKYNAAKLKFEMGMITNSELISILNDLNTSEIEYEKARLAHILAVEKYGYEITIGL